MITVLLIWTCLWAFALIVTLGMDIANHGMSKTGNENAFVTFVGMLLISPIFATSILYCLEHLGAK